MAASILVASAAGDPAAAARVRRRRLPQCRSGRLACCRPDSFSSSNQAASVPVPIPSSLTCSPPAWLLVGWCRHPQCVDHQPRVGGGHPAASLVQPRSTRTEQLLGSCAAGGGHRQGVTSSRRGSRARQLACEACMTDLMQATACVPCCQTGDMRREPGIRRAASALRGTSRLCCPPRLAQVWQESGWRGFWRGVLPSLVRELCSRAPHAPEQLPRGSPSRWCLLPGGLLQAGTMPCAAVVACCQGACCRWGQCRVLQLSPPGHPLRPGPQAETATHPPTRPTLTHAPATRPRPSPGHGGQPHGAVLPVRGAGGAVAGAEEATGPEAGAAWVGLTAACSGLAALWGGVGGSIDGWALHLPLRRDCSPAAGQCWAARAPPSKAAHAAPAPAPRPALLAAC